MNAEPVVFTRSWAVGPYTATLTVPDRSACVVVEWSPDFPARLTPSERAQYEAGRDESIAAFLAAEYIRKE